MRYSLSPVMHNAAYRALGVDIVYVALPALEQDVETAVGAIRAFGMVGTSVTIPLKSAVVPHLDELSYTAQRLGAVNCITNEGGRLTGYNTDGAGFVNSLLERDFDPREKRVALLGAGGSARAVALALCDAGAAQVKIINRSPERAVEVATLAGAAASAGSMHDVAEADLVVNATPIGMDGSLGGESPVDVTLLHAGQTVADLVYHPLDTPLLQAATGAGARTVRGTGMLLHQAAEQIRLWTGQDAPITVMREALVS